MKWNPVLSTALLALLAAGSMPHASHAENRSGSSSLRQDIKLTSTRLDVKQPNGSAAPWGSALTLFNTPSNVTFHWRTDELGVIKAIWQVSKSNLLLCNTPAETFKVIKEGEAGVTPAQRQFTEFTIDFAQFVPAKPSATPEKYYVRVIPLNLSGQPVKACSSSISRTITYVELGSINITKVEEGGTFADVFFSTTTAMTPLVEASTSHPDSTSASGPRFKKGDVQSTGKPAIDGPLHNHRVRLLNLMPNTFFNYVVTATDKNGNKARKAAGFRTKSQSVKVTFEEVHVFDDSDELSEGDLAFGFSVGTASLFFSSGIDSGERRALLSQLVPPTFLQTTVTPNSKTLKISVLGVDNDETDFVPIGPFIATFLERCGPLAASCGDSAKASQSLSIYVSGPDESFTQSFTLSAVGKSLKFTVSGKFHVFYE